MAQHVKHVLRAMNSIGITNFFFLDLYLTFKKTKQKRAKTQLKLSSIWPNVSGSLQGKAQARG